MRKMPEKKKINSFLQKLLLINSSFTKQKCMLNLNNPIKCVKIVNEMKKIKKISLTFLQKNMRNSINNFIILTEKITNKKSKLLTRVP